MAETWTSRSAPDCRREPGDAARAFGVQPLEIAGAPLEQDAHQVHHQLGAGDRARDRRLVRHARRERHDLADLALRLQEARRRSGRVTATRTVWPARARRFTT